MAIILRVIDGVGVNCKFCPKCCEWKPLYMFSRSKRDKDGYRVWCKECSNASSVRSRLKYKRTGQVYKWEKPIEIIDPLIITADVDNADVDYNEEEVNDAETL